MMDHIQIQFISKLFSALIFMGCFTASAEVLETYSCQEYENRGSFCAASIRNQLGQRSSMEGRCDFYPAQSGQAGGGVCEPLEGLTPCGPDNLGQACLIIRRDTTYSSPGEASQGVCGVMEDEVYTCFGPPPSSADIPTS